MYEKQLRRSREGVLGGVCSGIAEYFGIDAVVVRIIAVVGTLSTAGLLAVAYVALLFVVPRKTVERDVVDVSPQEATSDRFGPLDCASPCCGRAGIFGRTVSRSQARNARPCGSSERIGVGHLPPEPPVDFTKR